MNLPALDLKNHLIKMGMPILQEIIGREELEAISLITNKSINETMIAELLIKSHGEEIFSERLLRGYVIHFLPANYKSYLEFNNENKLVDESVEKKIINRAWNRNFQSHFRLIEIFSLSHEYLPDETTEDNNSFILRIDHNSDKKSFFNFLIKKLIKFFKSLFFKKNVENFGLEDFQIRIKNKLTDKIEKKNFKIMIHMPTGSGKTKTTIASLIDYNRKTNFLTNNYIVWLAHSDELCDQAKNSFEDLWKLYGTQDLPLIRLKDQPLDEIKNIQGGIIICTYPKLHRMRINSNSSKILEHIRTKSKFIIADEAHMVPATTFSESIEFITKLDFTILLGLSATPGGYYVDQTEKLSNYFLKNKISITDENNNELNDDEPISYLQKIGVLAKIKAHQVKTDFNFEFTEEEKSKILNSFDEGLNPELIKEMGENVERNICIYGELTNLYEKNLSTIVFACSLKHTKLLHKICILSGMKVGKIDDKTTNQARKKIIRDFKNKYIKIIFNYGVLSTGFDAPGTEAILIARPTTSPITYSQMLGRGLRGPLFGGKSECILIDIKDNLIGLPDEKSCFTLFNNYYTKDIND
jgi:superfamily II DNA or RNA helicase